MGGASDLETGVNRRILGLYGRGPGHIVAMLFAYGVTAYAILSIFANPKPWSVLLWLGGAIVAHDFVFLPLYTALYRGARRLGAERPGRVLALQHVAVPAMLSFLLFLAGLPLILQLSEANYRPTTGMTQDPYLGRWLAVTAALFVLSALAYALRARRAKR